MFCEAPGAPLDKGAGAVAARLAGFYAPTDIAGTTRLTGGHAHGIFSPSQRTHARTPARATSNTNAPTRSALEIWGRAVGVDPPLDLRCVARGVSFPFRWRNSGFAWCSLRRSARHRRARMSV